jgi:replicative DNA helicase
VTRSVETAEMVSVMAGVKAHEDERALLAYALQPGGAVEVLELIRPMHLNSPDYAEYLDLMAQRLARHEAVDEASMLAAVMTLRGRFPDPMAFADLTGAGGRPRTTSALEDVVARIRERHLLRRAREASATLAEIGAARLSRLDGDALPTDPSEAVARVGEFLLELSSAANVSEESDLGDAAEEAANERRAARASGRKLALTTGHPALNDILDGGFRPGDMVVVAGATSMGKSAFSFGAAADLAELGEQAAIVSLEMPMGEVATRVLSRVSGADLRDLRRGDLDDHPDIVSWREYLRGIGMRIWHPPGGATMSQIAAKAMAWRSKGIRMLVVDHLGRVKHDPSARGQRYDLQVTEVAKGCKSLALALQIPVLLLVQLNREGSKRTYESKAKSKGKQRQHEEWWHDFPMPQLSDLMESSGIEQEADIVLFPVRGEEFGLNDPSSACVCVGKQRNGAKGIVPALWDPRTASYRPVGDR